MPTRKVYVAVSRRLQGREHALKLSWLAVWFAGFLLLLVLSQILADPALVVSVGGRLWFSTLVVLGVLYSVVLNFNPARDLLDGSMSEGVLVILMDIALAFSVLVWFVDD